MGQFLVPRQDVNGGDGWRVGYLLGIASVVVVPDLNWWQRVLYFIGQYVVTIVLSVAFVGI